MQPFLRALRRTRAATHLSARGYNFGAPAYAAAFGDLPAVDATRLRADAIAYVEAFDESAWYDDPVATVIGGREKHERAATSTTPTTDNFGQRNGAMRLATGPEAKELAEHLTQWAGAKDYREGVRACERALFSEKAAALIGNQVKDFGKQDGVTEIEESLEASEVERRLVDQLLADEAAGVVEVNRAPVLVACVSNFSNFLDLSRKTLRHLEVGAPVVVLSRSHTTQHCYRWVQMLFDQMAEHGVPAGLLSYYAADLEDQVELMRTLGPDSPLHMTCSRAVAKLASSGHANVLASTGGPNTMVLGGGLGAGEAAQLRSAATIEHAGQCTALRLVVGGTGVEADDVRRALTGAPAPRDAADALKTGEFAGIFPGAPAGDPPWGASRGYVEADRVALRARDCLPVGDLDEAWRQPVVDAALLGESLKSKAAIADLCEWLDARQPISLAVNGDAKLALELFERTALVVYSVGGGERPAASTCQARPQDAEIFGEVPPRRELREHTRFPMVTPSAAPAYNAAYASAYLVKASAGAPAAPALAPLLALVEDEAVRGYCRVVADFLNGAAGPRKGAGARTTLWGWQRPPLGKDVVLRCAADFAVDDVAPSLAVFLGTNARDQVRVSVAPGGEALAAALADTGVCASVEDDAAHAASSKSAYDVVAPDALRARGGLSARAAVRVALSPARPRQVDRV
mmetsp:Transcript_6582/g.20739  ORF Transcript_6582/g.20739 Transcript_6582/m.20739 type:complete len:691 (+) Transcript_6582:238-2310(+)